MKLTPFRREVLTRLAEGPQTIDEARNGHPNILPTLIMNGWVRSADDHRYEITEAGAAMLAAEPDITGKST